jgi:branched-chain amino acid transport system substrate-binding protein
MKRLLVCRVGRTGCWVGVTLVALFAAVGSAAPPDVRAAQESSHVTTLRVGALLDLTSGWTSLGRGSKVTLAIAAKDANRRLAKAGSPVRVRVQIVDVRGKPNEAVRQLRHLARQGVRVFIGPESSSEVRALRTAANRLGVMVVSQGSTAHSLARAGDNVFRLVPDDRREAEAVVALLKHDHVKAIAPIWRDDAGNAGLVKSLRVTFKGLISEGVAYGTSESDFSTAVAALRQQVGVFQGRKAGKVAVYLAAFDEVVDLFHAAATDKTLSSVPWYGSDGVALTTRLVKDPTAAAFAAGHGYPNPTLGLDTKAERRSAKLRARVRARLGSQPDAFALTTYDGLQIIAQTATRTGGVSLIGHFKREFARIADGYEGVTGKIVLNAAGDRAFGSFDFWAVCGSGAAFSWQRTNSYLATGVGRGRIVQRQGCRTR